MEARFNLERLSQWLADVASTEDEEIDCSVIDDMLETIAATSASGAEIRAVLPAVALHLEHCPDCRDWYDTLVELAKASE